jgi:hypothetical protein
MPYRYRRFYYNGPITIVDWILDTWIPRHRDLVIDAQYIKSQFQYGDWGHFGNRVQLRLKIPQGTQVVNVIFGAAVHRNADETISELEVDYAHAWHERGRRRRQQSRRRQR